MKAIYLPDDLDRQPAREIVSRVKLAFARARELTAHRLADATCASSLMRAARDAGHHFFDADNMRYFGSRLLTVRRGKDGLVYFVTSERRPRSSDARMYTVRRFDGDNITTPAGEPFGFQAFRTLKAAQRHLAKVCDDPAFAAQVFA